MQLIKRMKEMLGLGSVESLNGYLKIEGWLTPAEAEGLFEIAATLPKSAQVLEIGSWKGKSTYCIAHGMKMGTINCIDPFNAAGEEGSREIYEQTKGDKNLIEQFEENLSKIPSSVKIKTLKGYSREFVNQVGDLDFLFIDGDHSIEGCRFDFENFGNDIKSGGFLAFHDYYPDRIDLGPTWVVDNLLKNNNAYSFYKSFDTLCVFKKIQKLL
jgi:predicted O-methyltransferase YrrM